MTLLPVHILAGLVGLVSGGVALFTFKGGRVHRRSGMVFVYAMLVMAGSAVVLAVTMKPNPTNVLQGVLTGYLVLTGLLTVQRHARSIDVAAMLIALAVGIVHYSFAVQAAQSPAGKIHGYPPPLFVVFGTIALLAASGDVRMLLSRPLEGARRLKRHLWRMSFALFIATGSFFLGQAKVIPKPIRIMPLLTIAALLPLVLMFYWLARVSRRRSHQWSPGTH